MTSKLLPASSYVFEQYYLKLIAIILRETFQQQTKRTREQRALFWFNRLYDTLHEIGPLSLDDEPTEADKQWLKSLVDHFFHKSPIGGNGIHLAFRVLLEAIDTYSSELIRLIITYMFENDVKKFFLYQRIFRFAVFQNV